MIDVFDLSLRKGMEQVRIAPSLVAQMCVNDKWVSQGLVDNYLECLVLKDTRQCEFPHTAAHVPTSFFSHATEMDNSIHTEMTHFLFLKQQLHDYDVVTFVGMHHRVHCFAVILMVKQKEVFIFDPLQHSTTIPLVAKFLQFLFQHFKSFCSGEKKIR